MKVSITARQLICTTLFWPLCSSCFFSERKARKLYQAAIHKTYDVLIVPGVPLDDGKWSRTMKGRIYWSKFLYDHGIAKNIMYSGNSVYSPYYEGQVMALYAEAIGIPKEHILYEIKAEHSTENIYYAYKKAKQLGYKTFALASDRFQTKTLKRFTRKKVSPDIALFPMLTDTLKAMDPTMKDPGIDYEQAFNKDFISIKKRQSYVKRLKGTLGKNIDYKLYE